MALQASVSIDVDTLSSIYKGFGCTRTGGYTFVELHTGLENMARFFEPFGIHATLFMVGNDFNYAGNHAYIREVHKAGYEIANHSMTHPQGFRWLSAGEKEEEIFRMDEVCNQVTGSKPVGFRSPGWNMDDTAIPVLKKHGYIYDSSVFPTILMPVMKFAHWASMSGYKPQDRTTMGMAKYMTAPLVPYRADASSLSRKGQNGLIEIPVTVTPWLRLPFFATLLLFAGFGIYRHLYRFIRQRLMPIHFQMHLSDFVDYRLPELADQMPPHSQGAYVPQALHTPLTQKLDIFRRMIDLISRDYEFSTLQQWACGEEFNL